MKGEKEFYGRLKGFDDYLNMIMEDVKEFSVNDGKTRQLLSKHKNMLLNGSHICMLIPGEKKEFEKHNQIGQIRQIGED